MRERIQRLLIPALAVLLIVFSVGFLIGRNAAQNDTVIQVSRKPTPAFQPYPGHINILSINSKILLQKNMLSELILYRTCKK